MSFPSRKNKNRNRKKNASSRKIIKSNKKGRVKLVVLLMTTLKKHMTHLWYFVSTVASLEPASQNVYSLSGPWTLAGLDSVIYGNDGMSYLALGSQNTMTSILIKQSHFPFSLRYFSLMDSASTPHTPVLGLPMETVRCSGSKTCSLQPGVTEASEQTESA